MTNNYFKSMKNKEKPSDMDSIIKGSKYSHFYIKLDGTHIDLHYYVGEPIKMITREGNDVAHLVPYLVEELENCLLAEAYQGVFACELVHVDAVLNDPRSSWSLSRNVLGRKEYDHSLPKIQCVIYDVYESFKKDVTDSSYWDRLQLYMPKTIEVYSILKDLECGLTNFKIPTYIPMWMGKDYWKEFIETKKNEGLVLFDLYSYQEFDKTFAKMKPDINLDAVVLKMFEGKKGTRLEGKIGAFEIGLFKDNTIVSIGKVPTMSDTERTKWTQRMHDGFQVGDYVIEVTASEVTTGNKLRFPSYLRERTDKKYTECLWEQIE